MNWVHAENLIQAQILAAAALTPEKNYIAVSEQEKQHSCHWTVDLAPVFHTIITTVVAIINVHVMVPWLMLSSLFLLDKCAMHSVGSGSVGCAVCQAGSQ